MRIAKEKVLNCANYATQNNATVFCDILVSTMQRKNLLKNSIVSAMLMAALCGMLASGCSVILGKEDGSPQQEISLRFLENLRNEASLRGEGMKDLALNTDRATTLQQPNSVFADAFRVYVTDTTPARVFIFDRGERSVTILDHASPPAEDEVSLIAPKGVVVDAAGTLWVSDSQQGKVYGYTKNGKSLYVIGKFGELATPAGLAVDYFRSRLYVADTGAQQVKVFNLTGERLHEGGRAFGGRFFEIGASGKSEEDFKFPGAIALDRSGNLYVLDTIRKRVHLYDTDANFVRAFSLSGDDPGVAVKPTGIAVDSNRHLYVTDSFSNNVLIFDQEGRLMLTWGMTGALHGGFRSPAGIFIDDRDSIYIADKANGRVQVFQYSP